MSQPERYSRVSTTPFCGAEAFALLADVETVLRLAPQWSVKEIRAASLGEGSEFEVDVEFDSNEVEATLACRVARLTPGSLLDLEMRAGAAVLRLVAQVETLGAGSRVTLEIDCSPPPGTHALLEFDMWARSMLNYIHISNRGTLRSRLWRRFLDRWWLRMPQSGKRMAIIVLMAEAISLALLVILLLIWKYY